MANSRIPGCLGIGLGPWMSARTPGPLGFNDQSDPNLCTLLGDTPGPLGSCDWGDPTLPCVGSSGSMLGSSIFRTWDGYAISLGADLCIPAGTVAQVLITKEQLAKIFPNAKLEYLGQVATELNTDLVKYGLDTLLRKAHFFAQVRQEGGAALEAKVESLNYSPDGLKNTFKYYRNNPAEAVTDGYVRDPKTKKITTSAKQETIANNVYASRNGNGDSASGDGWSYRGRGLIQVTGRSNYADAAKQYRTLYSDANVDFVTSPELMATFPYTVRSAVCFWIQHGLHLLADRGAADADVDRITTVINSLTDSYGERRQNFKTAQDAFK